MPRVPYFRGNIANAATAVAPGVRADAMDGAGASIGRSFAGLFAPPDPTKLAQADYYAAQADNARAEAFDRRSKTSQAMRGDSALADTGNITVAPEEDGTEGGPEHLSAAFNAAYTRAIQGGADPKKALESLAGYAATKGPAGEEALSRLVYAISGKGLTSRGGSEAISTTAQTALNDADMAHDTENEVRKDLRAKYGFDTQATTSIANNQLDNSTARRGQDITAGTTRRGQDLADRRAGLTADSVNNTVETTTLDPGDPGSKGFFGIGARAPTPGSKTVTKTSVTGRRSATAGAAAAPAAPANDPFPGVADGQTVVQDGHRYRRQGNKMVPVT